MAYKILYTEDALGDLEVILDYIRADNQAAAERFGTALLNHTELLQNLPYIGAVVSQRSGVAKPFIRPCVCITEFTKTSISLRFSTSAMVRGSRPNQKSTLSAAESFMAH